jgi:hypothetical protein
VIALFVFAFHLKVPQALWEKALFSEAGALAGTIIWTGCEILLRSGERQLQHISQNLGKAI